ncbi:Uncharacterised protein [Yersinia pseudotuberculosis]|uniref:hypothetical protein n=1 Tax=Yersinia pseudotuberculosis TaxID=633 RepID=UPI0005DFFFAD|nr:hypothetical protein [Yersinia pseudotuberculosis]BCU90728.1 hypothetical protein YP72344_22230 [Yersinia pseudotuberculosis]CNF68644.1 Uncharacterised protein [Yersinia pseudotuberculosis]CNL44158.1 Uncharacterised protein [Yersinia pseudotuberculosis]
MDITSGVVLAKQAYDLLKVIIGSRDAAVINSAVGELREKITDLQMLNAELAGLYHAEKQVTMKLADENTKIEMFASQAAEYEVHKTAAGSIVYRSKSPANDQVGHYYLCATCYQKREISILQPTGKVRTDALNNYCKQDFCPACETTYLMHNIP